MKYAVIRTDTADAGIRKIVLYIAQNFGNTVALEKLDEIEKRILELGEDPYIGTEPRYLILKRQGYKVLILEKDLVFYKIDEENKQVIVYAVVDQRRILFVVCREDHRDRFKFCVYIKIEMASILVIKSRINIFSFCIKNSIN